jgi:ubiquitin C-terminal hydrolase
MLNSYLRHYWLTGVATAAICATAAYVAFGIPLEKPHERKCKKNRGSLRISGLANEGNTCFINTTLQALASCPSFIQWITTLLFGKKELQSLETLQSLHTILLGIIVSISY